MPLPPGLSVPVDVALARAVDRIPGPSALPGGCRYEPKWDGYRAVVVVDAGSARLYSRRGTDMSAQFPEVVAAATEQIAPGTVLDGELVIWSGGRLDFEALQRRMTRGPRAAEAVARELPASLVLFDLLAVDGQDVRGGPFDGRRAMLEELATGWRPPLNLSPVTDDVDAAAEWFEAYAVAGVEGLVVKGGAHPYRGGERVWVKVKHRRTLDVVCGAVIGSRSAPQQVVAGLSIDGELRIVGRTGPLTAAARRALAPWLVAPAGAHPWPEQVSPGALGQWGAGRSSGPVTLTLVEPIVVEVSADVAWSGHSFRHSLRFLRARPDAEVTAVRAPER